jgi:hypothetical protein
VSALVLVVRVFGASAELTIFPIVSVRPPRCVSRVAQGTISTLNHGNDEGIADVVAIVTTCNCHACCACVITSTCFFFLFVCLRNTAYVMAIYTVSILQWLYLKPTHHCDMI